jgi:hypothetical protein
MRFAHICNLDGMQKLFSAGLATARDTAPDGWTLLHVSISFVTQRYSYLPLGA